MDNRLRSPVAWGTIISLIVLVSQVFGLHKKIGIEQNELVSILNGILAVFIAFGILNNPTDRGNF